MGQTRARLPLQPFPLRAGDHAGEALPGGARRGVLAQGRLQTGPCQAPRRDSPPGDWPRGARARLRHEGENLRRAPRRGLPLRHPRPRRLQGRQPQPGTKERQEGPAPHHTLSVDNIEGPLLALTIVLMLIGLIGSVVPGLPGVTLIFLSALLYAILTDFQTVGAVILVVLFLFAALAFITDFVATSYGARRFGASNWGTVGGAVGGIVGALAGLLLAGIGSLFGLIVGTIAGVFVGEYLKRERHGDQQEEAASSDWHRASRAAGGVLIGYLASAVAQGGLGLASVVIFV